jgi:uncharacterized protein
MARERGLEPLAEWLGAEAKASHPAQENPVDRARPYVDPEKDVPDVEAALAGARDIIAEHVNENADIREQLRRLFREQGMVTSRVLTGKEKEGAKFRDYFDWSEPVSRVAGHRVLAMRRGEKEKILTMRVAPPEEPALAVIVKHYVTNRGPIADQVILAVTDGYRRLLSVALETELRLELKKRADEEAIGVFADNVRELLLAPPLGPRRILALDPGFRTGCKLVVLDARGDLLHNDTI